MPAPSVRSWSRWGLVLLAALPLQLPLLQHAFSGPEATGFIYYDGPYYLANARAIFERGNGFAYPNAFDPSPNSPVIYFHWLLWLLGAGVKFLHLDPGALFATTGVAATIVGAALTYRLVELVLPENSARGLWFLLTMWGGGVVVLATMSVNLASGQPGLSQLFRYATGEGWWFSSWGLNFLFATEAVYHALVAASWIGVLQRRWSLAIGAVAALAATHPFAGAQHLLILGAWLAVLAWRERSRAAWLRLALIAGISATFAAYYFIYLPRFPAHRTLMSVWSGAHEVRLVSLLLEVGPWFAVAVWRWRHERWAADALEWFWVVAAGVTLLLLQHDLFIGSRQPAHFSRGYFWLPLWLLALPQLQAWAGRLADWGRAAALSVVVIGGTLIVSDTLAFIARDLDSGAAARATLAAEQREMLVWMDRANLRGVLLAPDARLGYLSAAYSGVRPFLGHLNNTPDIRSRWADFSRWQREGRVGPWFEEVDYLLIDRRNPPAYDWSAWRELHRNGEYLLLSRRTTATR
jgi:hypothetical protein